MMHLSTDFWTSRLSRPNEVLMPAERIAASNRDALATDPSMVELAAYPEQLSTADARAVIRSMSKPSEAGLYFRDGTSVGDRDHARYSDNLNLDALNDPVPVRFGMIVQRTDMRTWPTADAVYKSEETIDLDRFQENGLFPGEAIAVLHESRDGEWYFVQSYNYAAWVRKDHIALGDRNGILAYLAEPDYLVVAGARASTNYDPQFPGKAEVQLDMGVRLPLADLEAATRNGEARIPKTTWAVRLPTHDEDGRLGFRIAMIARSQDVRQGYLPFTRENLVRQSFKFLGERYGWGHSYNARDCTGLVLEVYKSFGILLPRNSGQQGNSPIGRTIRFTEDSSDEEKLAALAASDIGDLLYAPGHVMMYLGTVDRQPYVIHDLSGIGYIDKDDEHYQGVLQGVSVTPLTPLHMSPESTYFETMYAIKQIR